MPTARQHASLDTDVLEAGGDADDPTASARLAGMLQRLQALRPSAPRPTVAPVACRPPQSSGPVPVSITAANREDGLFYDKGAATADGFRPWYWSYERPADALQEQAAISADAPIAAASPASVEAEMAPGDATVETAVPKP